MKTQETICVIKNLWTGLFWDNERKQWMLPDNAVDVLMLAINEKDYEKVLSSIPKYDHKDCILTIITVETNIIF